jgi:putative phosphoserine phosphatase/1-acylglycerol-3-phosphate O-acyltransferase
VASLAIFDLDGTLVPWPSAELRLLSRLLREGLLGPRQLALGLAFGLHALAPGGSLRSNKAYLAGLEVSEVERAAERFVDDTLVVVLRPGIVARLRAHQAEGVPVLLVTGSLDFVARPLCRRLGVAHWIATECAASGGRFSAAAPRVHPRGRAKLELARAFCAARGLRLGEAIAYGNSGEDAWLLGAVGRAVAVHPDPRLARVARARDWSIVSG